MNLEHDRFHDDEEQEDYGPRSIFAAGWFRAVLAMTVLAIIVVVALPYLLNWFEPVPPPIKPSARSVSDTSVVSSSSVSAPTDGADATTPLPQAAPERPVTRTVSKPVTEKTRPATPAPSASSAPARVTRTATLPSRPDRMVTGGRLESAQREGTGRYWVQLGIFKEEQNAERLARKLRNEGFSVQLARVRRSEASAANMPAGAYHVVRAGGFADSVRAVAARDTLGGKGYSGFVTEGDAK